MKINLLVVGKTDSAEIKKLIAYYTQRMPKYIGFEMLEIPELKNAKNLRPEQIKAEEKKLLLAQIQPGDYVILLDEKGKEYSSNQMADKLSQHMLHSIKRLLFVVGGAYGFDDELYALAKEKIALSKMTFTHQMVRLFFIEQIYRAYSIIEGKPYHNN
jgi:23S rRNA (pseudouridine1915-N3)-methyltransferase